MMRIYFLTACELESENQGNIDSCPKWPVKKILHYTERICFVLTYTLRQMSISVLLMYMVVRNVNQMLCMEMSIQVYYW